MRYIKSAMTILFFIMMLSTSPVNDGKAPATNLEPGKDFMSDIWINQNAAMNAKTIELNDYIYLKEVISGIQDFQSTITTPKNGLSEIQGILKYLYNSPVLFFVDTVSAKITDDTIMFIPQYNMSREEWRVINGYMIEIADNIAQKTTGMCDIEKATYINNWLMANVRYDNSVPLRGAQNSDKFAYHSILEGKGVCSSYALAYAYLGNHIGLDVAYVTGYAGGEYHAWNLVKLSSGELAVDVTWNDSSTSAKWLLVKKDAFAKDHITECIYWYNA